MPIKLEFSASVGLIHKESVTMQGHTILKVCIPVSVRSLPFIEYSSLFRYYAVSTVNISEDLNFPYHRCENPKSRVCS